MCGYVRITPQKYFRAETNGGRLEGVLLKNSENFESRDLVSYKTSDYFKNSVLVTPDCENAAGNVLYPGWEIPRTEDNPVHH
jgi:hypothetical protein